MEDSRTGGLDKAVPEEGRNGGLAEDGARADATPLYPTLRNTDTDLKKWKNIKKINSKLTFVYFSDLVGKLGSESSHVSPRLRFRRWMTPTHAHARTRGGTQRCLCRCHCCPQIPRSSTFDARSTTFYSLTIWSAWPLRKYCIKLWL